MDVLSRLFAVLTVTLTVGGVTSLAEQAPHSDTRPPVLVAQNEIGRAHV